MCTVHNIRRWNESASKSQCHSHRVWHTFPREYVHWHGICQCLTSIACLRMVCDGQSSGWDDECCIEKSEKSQNHFGICRRDDDYVVEPHSQTSAYQSQRMITANFRLTWQFRTKRQQSFNISFSMCALHLMIASGRHSAISRAPNAQRT